jgi:endonuclease/exonuclease/phosphatase family metal-dependent hydrolase
VAFVQEALLNFTVSPAEGELFWSIDRGSDSGTAVFVRAGITASAIDVRARGSYVAAVTVQEQERPIVFASAHVGPGDYQEHRLALADALAQLVAGKRFIVGGDLNTARHWDKVYGGRQHAAFFEGLAARGFQDCHWMKNQREVQSFWGHQAKEAYQCDHLFADESTSDFVITCGVIDNPTVRALSDHGPISVTLHNGIA